VVQKYRKSTAETAVFVVLACRSDRVPTVAAVVLMVDDTQDMENKTHHRVQ